MLMLSEFLSLSPHLPRSPPSRPGDRDADTEHVHEQAGDQSRQRKLDLERSGRQRNDDEVHDPVDEDAVDRAVEDGMLE